MRSPSKVKWLVLKGMTTLAPSGLTVLTAPCLSPCTGASGGTHLELWVVVVFLHGG